MLPAYLEVDLQEPLMWAGGSLLFFVFALPILIHAWVRKARFKKLSTGYQTHALRQSIRIEGLIGAAVLAVGIVMVSQSWIGFNTAWNNLEANINEKYQPTELAINPYNGSWVSVDITLDDGTSFDNTVVEIREAFEPFIADVWYHQNPDLPRYNK